MRSVINLREQTVSVGQRQNKWMSATWCARLLLVGSTPHNMGYHTKCWGMSLCCDGGGG